MTTLTTILLSRDLDMLLRACLAHLDRDALSAPLAGHRIVVVDNASRRPLAPALPSCPPYDLIRLDTHHGFGAACNRAWAAAPADFVLLLNNDVLLYGGVIRAMLDAFAAYPDLGICGARLLFPDGTVQHAGVALAPAPKGPYHLGRKRPPALVPAARERFQAVTGACMLVRGSVFDALGGFDEGFGFGYEDVDLCLRAGQLGFDVRCVQDTDALHFESMTPGRTELGVPTLGRFFARWEGRYTIDG